MTMAAAAGLLFLAGIVQHGILSGRDASVVVSTTNLRAMPVLGGDPGVEAQTGELVRVLGRQGAWTRVELSDGRRGWIEAQRLEGIE
jgi:uncharacterized protein YgiM (DUF1202 family)